MNSFIAAPNQQHHVGQPICRSKRRCDVVTHIFPDNQSFIMGANACISIDLPKQPNINYRSMTWWESLKHELFGECACQ